MFPAAELGDKDTKIFRPSQIFVYNMVNFQFAI